MKTNTKITEQTINTEKKNKPEKKYRAKNVTATIWSKTLKTDKGVTYEKKNVVFEKSYKDKDDQWQTTNSYDMNDLIKLKVVLDNAITYLYANEETTTDEE